MPAPMTSSPSSTPAEPTAAAPAEQTAAAPEQPTAAPEAAAATETGAAPEAAAAERLPSAAEVEAQNRDLAAALCGSLMGATWTFVQKNWFFDGQTREMCSYAKCWYSGEDLPALLSDSKWLN